ncbi:MAG: PRC-barrel domain-containing protein [Firmicutes bacterium]|nr:PRC-barrel domain-containing protein [Bacillota bacterium]
MEKSRRIIGLPVIVIPGEKELGFVKDVVYNSKEKQVKAVIIEKMEGKSGTGLIMLEDINEISSDGILINKENEKRIEQYRYKKGNKNYNKSKTKKTLKIGCSEQLKEIKDTKIYSKSGNELGVVKDVLFDYRTGNIEGVEISDGILQDLMEGRKIIPLIGKYEFGEDGLLVDNDAVEEIIDTGGGIKNKLFGESKIYLP